MAAVTAAVVGGAAAVGGAVISAKGQKDAAKTAAQAAQFRPFDVTTGTSSVRFGPGDSVTGIQDPNVRQLSDRFTQAGLAEIDPNLSSITDFDRFSRSIGAGFGGQGGFFDQFGQGLDAQSLGFQQATGGLGEAFGRSRRQGNQLSGRLNRLARGPGRADQAANFAIGRGQDLLQQDFRGAVSNTLANLRESARPAEERAVNSRVQSLFDRGILSGTAGARAFGELSAEQERADLARQIQAENLGLSAFTASQQAGRGLLGQGIQGILSGQQGNVQAANVLGDLGFRNILNQSNQAQNLFQAQIGQANLAGQQGLQRLSTAQSLFGFGQNLRTDALNRALAAQGGTFAANTDLRNLIALGGNIGGQQASAGAAQAQAILAGGVSPVGAGLSGFGTGLFNTGLDALVNESSRTPSDSGGSLG